MEREEYEKKLPVPGFNKREIEEIARGAVNRGIDLEKFNPNDYVLSKSGLSIDEALENGLFPDVKNNETTQELTDTQFQKVKALLIKAIKDGIFLTDVYCLFINAVSYRSERFIDVCFGCSASAVGHEQFGFHLEIELDLVSKTLFTLVSEI